LTREGATALLGYLDGIADLCRREVRTQAELDAWAKVTVELWLQLQGAPGKAEASDLIPAALWDFVADADVRFDEGNSVSGMSAVLLSELTQLSLRARATLASTR
jgi:hypothetical protein